MSVTEELSRAWDSLQAGWRALMERAANALTRFIPGKAAEKEDEQAIALRRASPGWSMLAAEVRETADEISVRIEVPGMEPDQFDIEVRGRELRIRGEKHIARERDQGRYHVTERAYGCFERRLPLPAEVDDAQATANYRKGVLQVRLPKQTTSRHQQVKVRTD